VTERLDDGPALESYLAKRSIRYTRSTDGTWHVPIALGSEVAATSEVRWERSRGRFQCSTMLPFPVASENRNAVVAALAAINVTLAGSTFVVADDAVCHVTGAELGEDGSLPSDAVERALETTRAACDAHFPELFRAVFGAERLAAANVLGTLEDAHLAQLRREVEAVKLTFARRLDRPFQIDEVDNAWFRRHRILFLLSPLPMPALGLVMCLTPAGRFRVLAGNVAALNEVALAEGIELTDDEDARAYANLVISWSRDADFPELSIDAFDEIPFRSNASEADWIAIERARRDAGDRVMPPSFVRTDGGWRLDAWLVSVSRLLRRTADLRADGTVDVREEIVAPKLPVPPGALWNMVGGRLVPVG